MIIIIYKDAIPMSYKTQLSGNFLCSDTDDDMIQLPDPHATMINMKAC